MSRSSEFQNGKMINLRKITITYSGNYLILFHDISRCVPKDLCGRYTEGPILRDDGIDLRGVGFDLIPSDLPDNVECPDEFNSKSGGLNAFLGGSKMVCCAESEISQRLCSDYEAKTIDERLT